MVKDYKKPFFIVIAAFSLFFLAAVQISFLNNFTWEFNIFLILTVFLILNKKFYGAVFLGWFGGFLFDTAGFSKFGTTSLIFLIIICFTAIFIQKALFTAKTGGVLIAGIISVLSYHFLEWIINIIALEQEKFSFYFINGGIIFELALTPAILFLMFYIQKRLRLNV